MKIILEKLHKSSGPSSNLKYWISKNILQLNTNIYWFRFPTRPVSIMRCLSPMTLTLHDSAKNQGFILDSMLKCNMSALYRNAAFFHMRNTAKLQLFFSQMFHQNICSWNKCFKNTCYWIGFGCCPFNNFPSIFIYILNFYTSQSLFWLHMFCWCYHFYNGTTLWLLHRLHRFLFIVIKFVWFDFVLILHT